MDKLMARLRSFKYAFNGIRLLLQQPNACIHAMVAVITVACGIWLKIAAWEWCVVALCIGVVLMAEALNSAIEALADKVSMKQDPLIGKTKDLAAGAVLLVVFAAIAAGLVIFLPKIIQLFK